MAAEKTKTQGKNSRKKLSLSEPPYSNLQKLKKKTSSFSKISRGTPKYTIFITKYFQKREHFRNCFNFCKKKIQKKPCKVKISKNSREKPQNSRKKPKTQGKNSSSRSFDTRPRSKLVFKKMPDVQGPGLGPSFLDLIRIGE